MARNRVLYIGSFIIILFCISVIIAGSYLLFGFFGSYQTHGNLIDEPAYWGIRLLIVFLAESIIFWIGIIMVYVTSVQLGARWRILGIVCGWIPIAHLIMLGIIIYICLSEARFESKKYKLNRERKDKQICKTRYPILLVHGVFFRDFKHFNYWGRIPEQLIENGATVYYGEHNSAAGVDDSAIELERRILSIIKATGCEKVNIIAHSKGGLDSRTCAAKTEAGKYIASITTINTPHRGCEFADYLLGKIPQKEQKRVARVYNAAAAKLGDVNPDFLSAVFDLTHEKCSKRNQEVFDQPDIYYQSVGSKLNQPLSGRFPLNMTYMLANHFDGPNDGLVGDKSFAWGADYQFLTVKGLRGISHGDMIDLNRENIIDFDVREFYVQLVAGLKNRGL